MSFVNIKETHFLQVARIYKEGLKTGLATFETSVPNWDQWNKSHHQFGRIGYTRNDKILGWAALSPTSSRKVYEGVAEVSVYVDEKVRGQGIGKILLQELIKISENNGIWTLQANIMDLNKTSITLHTNCGFRIIGYKEKIGNLNGMWLNNTMLERRSKLIGL
jgi:phosphinothricin acetyltransferase